MGGPGVQRVAWDVPFCTPPEAAVIFVWVSFELLGSRSSPRWWAGGVSVLGIGPGVSLAGRAFARFPRVSERPRGLPVSDRSLAGRGQVP